MDLQAALLAAISAEAAAIGVMWLAFNRKVHKAEEACEEDRRILRGLVERVAQLDRRKDWLPTDAATS